MAGRRFAAKDMIFAPGDPDDQAYLLLEGTVRLYKIYCEYSRIERDQGTGTIPRGLIRMISGDETYRRTNKKARGLGLLSRSID